ncbi:septum site-determining protein Ssd [Aquipuribacter nitratireducens]|uniref:Septum site-determining protein Ssd n=1 Tax=Aquipuribacter nitratireducens TaxID=650104 RepID=A0ABW0GU69_9MICO
MAIQGAEVLCLAVDPEVRAVLSALCAEAGVAATSHPGRSEPPGWRSAALVLLGLGEPAGGVGHDTGGAAEAAEAVWPPGLAGLPRREGVVVVHVPAPGAPVDPPGEVWRAAVAVGAEHVVGLAAGREWVVDRLRRAAWPSAFCVGVVGARGGAGATATAVALATAAARGAGRSGLRRDDPAVLLLDADPGGGGLDLALGAEELPGLRWDGLHDVRPPLPAGGLSHSLPTADGVRVLSHGRRAALVQEGAGAAVLAAARAEHAVVVLDLPRHPAAATVPGRSPARATPAPDVLLCVCPAEVRAVAAAPLVLRAWRDWPAARTHLLVRGPSPGGLRASEAGLAVAAGVEADGSRLHRTDEVRAEPRLAAALEHGHPFADHGRSPLRRWADRWVAEVLADRLPSRRGAAVPAGP